MRYNTLLVGVVAALSLCFYCGTASANTVLTSSWSPNPLGVCTTMWINTTAMYHVGPPYSGANANNLIAEGVGYSGSGDTCNFAGASSHMPSVYTNSYLIAASQDIYAGFHLPVCDSCSDKNSEWEALCETNTISQSDASDGLNMCSVSCGECLLVSGLTGSKIFIVNEIADVQAVGQNGKGLNLHLLTSHSLEVRDWNGVSKDIMYKRVPCPTSGSVRILAWQNNIQHQIYLYVAGNWGATAVYITVVNHKLGVKSLFTAGGAGGDQTWVPLVRDWVNRWHWESYGCSTCVSWQQQYGGITRGSTAGDFQLKIVATDGQTVTCTGLTYSSFTAGTVHECVNSNGKGQQFNDPTNVDTTACTSTSSATSSNPSSASSNPSSASNPSSVSSSPASSSDPNNISDSASIDTVVSSVLALLLVSALW